MPFTYEDINRVANELKLNLTNIKDILKSGNIPDETYDALIEKAKKVQDKLDVLLNNKGVLTQTDLDEAYKLSRETQKESLYRESVKSSRRAIIYGGLTILVIVGIVFYLRKK